MDKVRGGEAGNRLRGQPGLPGTGREGGLGYVWRDCFKFALCLTLSVDAKVVWCLNSGDIVNPSMGIRARLLSRTLLNQDTTPPRRCGSP